MYSKMHYFFMNLLTSFLLIGCNSEAAFDGGESVLPEPEVAVCEVGDALAHRNELLALIGVGDIPAIEAFDTSCITDMSSMFLRARNFNGDISGWDVSNVVDSVDFALDANVDLTIDKQPVFLTGP